MRSLFVCKKTFRNLQKPSETFRRLPQPAVAYRSGGSGGGGGRPACGGAGRPDHGLASSQTLRCQRTAARLGPRGPITRSNHSRLVDKRYTCNADCSEVQGQSLVPKGALKTGPLTDADSLGLGTDFGRGRGTEVGGEGRVSERLVPHAESGKIGLFMFASPAALKNASREIDLRRGDGFPSLF